ncbi:MAG TPA: hypothetical protein PLM53_13225 [Spirochaetota bacterium]|nr:hypothetical protein [Spirochaetota bacterium]HPC40405.1 hypothetical protein [Spirochaetota bacterium]HPL18784.1 hypothetical protein [Spirochaetota bacterium]HQF06472.1 hypothetical protein [Spirochaetota bacterium]HQH98057.1 hypothetical protein [Spirochaetota bacterium]
MGATFAIHHYPDPPAFYNIIIDRGDSVATFRIVQFDMLALQDGTEVKAESVDNGGSGDLGRPVDCGRGTVRLFDSGLCAIERWSHPVYIVHIAGRQFYGTLHILKADEGYSLRYVRSRANKPSPR